MPRSTSEQQAAPIQLLTYPEEWVSLYAERRYLAIDPVVPAAFSGILPVDWNSLPRESRAVKTLFAEAEEHGVGSQGITIPIRGCHGEAALACFTAEESGGDWKASKPGRVPLLHNASYLIHERVQVILGNRKGAVVRTLSPRELDCLKYCATGLRDEQIASTLRISRRVVSAYLDSARYKLQAATRPHAVARAVQLGLIPIEAIMASAEI
jgi:DNA-binding CsgD family transcriptional regulator